MKEKYRLRRHLLLGQKGWVGCSAKENRLFIQACCIGAGIPWRDLPDRFGDWKNTHRRWSHWAKTGVWRKIFKYLAADADNEYA